MRGRGTRASLLVGAILGGCARGAPPPPRPAPTAYVAVLFEPTPDCSGGRFFLCPGDGYTASAGVILAADQGEALSPTAIIDPVHLASSWDCGQKTRMLAPNDLQLLGQVAPSLASLPLVSPDEAPGTTAACRDPRIEVSVPPAAERRIEDGVHRFSLAEAAGDVVVRAAGRVIGSWQVGFDEIADACREGEVLPVRSSTDLGLRVSGRDDDRVVDAGQRLVEPLL
jgi:hypothetical protein